LERHINHYQPHQILRREAIKEGLYTSDSAYFITNPSPIHFTDSDCCILSRDDSTKQYQKIPTLPLPLSTDLNFDKTEKFISELTAYCPTVGPLSPIANDNQFDVEAVLDSLQDQEADVCVVPNQLVLGNTTISTQNVSDVQSFLYCLPTQYLMWLIVVDMPLQFFIFKACKLAQ
jgi:hypothetical protein